MSIAAFWSSLTKSMPCLTEESEVHDPSSKMNKNSLKRNLLDSGCSRSLTNLWDVVDATRRYSNKEKLQPPIVSSPRSSKGNEIENYTRYVSGAEIMTTQVANNLKRRLLKKVHGSDFRVSDGGETSFGSSNLVRRECRERFKNLDAIASHNISKHAVTELVEGDSSRKIVEMICKMTMSDSANKSIPIEKILKVNHNQTMLAKFEEHRETVKLKAKKLSPKNTRCAADGNELLRFYGTTIACSLGTYGSSSPCRLHNCNVCNILRQGFSKKQQPNRIGFGVFTTSTSTRAYESIALNKDGRSSSKRALIVCRVVAGRVHKPLENFDVHDMESQIDGFDSLTAKVGQLCEFEELYVLSPNALLPCFVVICNH